MTMGSAPCKRCEIMMPLAMCRMTKCVYVVATARATPLLRLLLRSKKYSTCLQTSLTARETIMGFAGQCLGRDGLCHLPRRHRTADRSLGLQSRRGHSTSRVVDGTRCHAAIRIAHAALATGGAASKRSLLRYTVNVYAAELYMLRLMKN